MILQRNTNVSCENNDNGGKQRQDDTIQPKTNKSHRQKDEKQKQQHETSQSTNTYREDNTEVLLNMLIQSFNKLWQHLKRFSLFVMYDLGGYQFFDRVAQWCVQHPQMAICVLAAGLVAFLPIFLFFIFALSTIFMTLTGFLVLEGTLLTILTMIMFGLFGALAVVLLFFVLVAITTYFGVSQVYDMYGSTELQRNVLRSFMQRNNQNNGNANVTRNTNQNSQNENVVN